MDGSCSTGIKSLFQQHSLDVVSLKLDEMIENTFLLVCGCRRNPRVVGPLPLPLPGNRGRCGLNDNGKILSSFEITSQCMAVNCLTNEQALKWWNLLAYISLYICIADVLGRQPTVNCDRCIFSCSARRQSTNWKVLLWSWRRNETRFVLKGCTCMCMIYFDSTHSLHMFNDPWFNDPWHFLFSKIQVISLL